jgi:hypothetical protein
VVRATEQELVDRCVAALLTGLVDKGYQITDGGI